MFVPTRSSKLKHLNGEACETIEFKKKPKKARKNETNVNDNVDVNTKEEPKVDMRALRYEIIKFGSAGFDGSKKQDSRVALAVSLGAKPPKNKKKNYTQILAEKKLEKQEAAKLRKEYKVSPLFKKGNKTKIKKKNESKGLLDRYGKVTKERERVRKKF